MCVFDVQLLDFNSLALGIRDRVGEEILHHDGGLDGPPSLVSGRLVLLGHGLASDTAGVLSEGHDGLERQHVLEEFLRLARLHPLNVMGDFPAVLEVDAEVGPPRLGVRHSRIGFD